MVFLSYQKLLENLVLNDDRVIVLTAENRASIRNLPQSIGSRFIDVGIAEQTMIGLSAGLALRGKIPVVHSLAAFLTMRAFEFIRTDIGIPNLPVKLVGSVPGFLSEANGPTHQALEDIGLMSLIPGMNIFCPADEEELLLGLPKVLSSNSPFYIRFNNSNPTASHDLNFEIGKAEVIASGSDITILTYGFILREAFKAKKVLDKLGFSVGLINLRTLKPIDSKEIIKAVRNSALTVTIEDHFITGGLFSIISAMLVKEKIFANVLPIALKDRWFKPALLENILEYERFNGEYLALKIVDVLQKEKKFIAHLYQ